MRVLVAGAVRFAGRRLTRPRVVGPSFGIQDVGADAAPAAPRPVWDTCHTAFDLQVRQCTHSVRRLYFALKPSALTPATWRSMSSDTTGDGAGISPETDDKTGEGSQASLPQADGAKEKEKKRMQRGRRDDRPNEDHNPVPIQPILSSETKTLMYELHAKDPAANSEEVLAARFGVSSLRVRAILMLQKRYHEYSKKNALATDGQEMEKLVERISGTTKTGFNSPFYQADRDGFTGMKADAQERNLKARPRPLFDLVDYHKAKAAVARLDEKYSGAGSFNPRNVEEARLQAAAAAEVPVTPIEQKHGIGVTMSKRFKYVFADISKGVGGAERMVVVREPDGTCRSASYEERYRIEQYVSPPKLPPA